MCPRECRASVARHTPRWACPLPRRAVAHRAFPPATKPLGVRRSRLVQGDERRRPRRSLSGVGSWRTSGRDAVGLIIGPIRPWQSLVPWSAMGADNPPSVLSRRSKQLMTFRGPMDEGFPRRECPLPTLTADPGRRRTSVCKGSDAARWLPRVRFRDRFGLACDPRACPQIAVQPDLCGPQNTALLRPPALSAGEGRSTVTGKRHRSSFHPPAASCRVLRRRWSWRRRPHLQKSRGQQSHVP